MYIVEMPFRMQVLSEKASLRCLWVLIPTSGRELMSELLSALSRGLGFSDGGVYSGHKGLPSPFQRC